MARKVLIETDYTFTPSTRTIVINENIPRERMVLITNVTSNQVLFNFSDSSLKFQSYTPSINTDGTGKTTMVLDYNTAAMSSTDKIQIIHDEYEQKFVPAEAQQDGANKFRVTTPQSLIDTDFEYGLQSSKWEGVTMINNRPFAFPTAVAVPGVTGIAMSTGSRVVTITTTSAHGLTVGTPIYVQDTFLSFANGNFIIETVPTSTTLTYTARAVNTTAITAIFDAFKTAVTTGSLYTGAAIGGTPTWAYSGQQVTVTTTVPHGLSIGNEIAITGTTASTNPPNGTFIVTTIDTPTQFKIYLPAAPTGTIASGTVYTLPQGSFLHRPFDGGVIFSNNASSNYEQAIRQTRRYFRYQSGKAIQSSTGTILKPNLQLDSITSVGAVATVQTREKHNIQPGTSITISGATDATYNGTFTVTSVTGYNTFQYTMGATPASGTGTGPYYCSVNSWYGSTNRMGIFDQQNGLFWQHDGQNLSVVRRNSTFQLSGRVSVTNGSNTVTQTSASFPTIFAQQAQPGDFIVIRGQSYKIQDIASNTSMTISPAYRAATTTMVTISKTVDTVIPQSTFNIDKLDGTGPSGYNADFSKMQMFYIDYTWYGAGAVRWGIRGTDGDIIYVHKMPNNNVNQEAYMRSGNLPARYEVSTFPPITLLTANVGSSDTVISVGSTSEFPSSGTLCIRSGSAYEYVNYAGKTSTTFTGLTRGKAGLVTAQTLTVAAGSNSATIASAAALQVGMRVVSASIPEGTFITNISGTTLTLSQAATAANPTDVLFPPMGATSGQTFTYSVTAPIIAEFAYPTFGSTLSHWGTSVIMDGRFDDDKSLVFTYGQTTFASIATGVSKALFSIRVAPSVDNGGTAGFGERDIINRMQLVLRALDITTRTASSSMLVRAFLNGTVSAATTWTNAVGNISNITNSSLAQIADHGTGAVTITGGEITGGFFVSTTSSISLESLRDLGNSINGGGAAVANAGIYPNGPDILTIVVTNLGAAAVEVLGRLSWTEAQA
jgi:hypothetical protein